jgi:hypothetical protein
VVPAARAAAPEATSNVIRAKNVAQALTLDPVQQIHAAAAAGLSRATSMGTV